MTVPTSKIRRIHFLGLLTLVFKSLKRHPRFRKVLYLQVYFYFLPALTLWLGLSALASHSYQDLAAYFPRGLNLQGLLEQQKGLLLAAALGILLTSLLSSLGFFLGLILNYQAALSVSPVSQAFSYVAPRPQWFRLMLRTFLASVLLLLMLGLAQVILLSVLPDPLSILTPLIAIYVFACATLLPLLLYSEPMSLFKALRSCLTLSFVDARQSKMSCAFSMLNSSILFYFLIMLGGYLKEEIALHLGAELFFEWARPLAWFGIKLSQFAFVGSVIESLVFAFATWLLASCIATIFYLTRLPLERVSKDVVNAQALAE